MRVTCKKCRRLGVSVCGREKCALKRKPYPPGEHGKSFRRGGSEYGIQLKEKQKVKFLYGLRERQFKNYVSSAVSQHKIPAGDQLVLSLESRLDNIVYRLGFAPTRASARQMVNHGHIWVSGRRVNSPSFQLKVGDIVEIRAGSRQKGIFANLDFTMKKYNPPEWIDFNKSEFKGKIIARPSTHELVKSYNINAIVEYYSR